MNGKFFRSPTAEADPARLAYSLAWIAAFAIVGIFVSSAFLLVGMQRNDHWVAQSQERLRLVRQARSLATDRETGVRGYLLTGDAANLAPDSSAQPVLRRVLDSLTVRAGSDTVRRRHVRELRDAIERWDAEFASPPVAIMNAGGSAAWLRSQLPHAGKQLFDAVRAQLTQLETAEDSQYVGRLASAARFRLAAAIILVVELAILGIALWWLARRTAHQTHAIEEHHASLQEQAVELEVTASELETTVTELREERERAETATALLRAVMDNAPVAVVATDADLNVILWNPAATALFGWSADEVLGKPVPFISEEQRGASRLLRDVALAGEAVNGHESERTHRDGHKVPVAISLAALEPHDPRTGWVVAFADIRQRLDLQRALVQSQKLEAIGRLAGGVAHDFNNVLTAIKGFAGLAQMSVDAGESPTQDIEEIEQAVDRAASLTRQLLTFSRRQMLEPRTTALNDVVRGVDPMLRRLIGAVAFETELDAGTGTIYADPTQVEQVVMNLVVNARDALPEGGHVTLRTSRRTVTERMPGVPRDVEPGDYAVLSVVDDGSGMSPEVVGQIFDPFFTTKPAGKGTGLGLSTVYGIVRDSGGYLRVDSAPGRGTTFEIFFPRTGDSSGIVRPVGGTPVMRAARILLVDDDPVVRESTARHLRHAGHDVLEASDGVAALDVYAERAQPIDLVVTDLVMPRMGGRELAEHLRRLAPGLKLLFISGYSDDPRLRERVIGLGAAYLGKPFTPDALLRRIDELING